MFEGIGKSVGESRLDSLRKELIKAITKEESVFSRAENIKKRCLAICGRTPLFGLSGICKMKKIGKFRGFP